jgi:hypothetical protein
VKARSGIPPGAFSISRLTPPNYIVGVNVIHLTIPMKLPFTPDYDALTKNTVSRFIP